MTTEEFMLVWNDTELRQYIVDEAKRHSHNMENQEDYIQEAWLYISLLPQGYDIDILKVLSHMTIYREYRREWEDRRVREAYYHDLALELGNC